MKIDGVWAFVSAGLIIGAFSSPSMASRTWEDSKAQADQCFADVNADPAIGLPIGKLVLGEPTNQQLSNSQVPSIEEADAIRLAAASALQCRSLMLSALREFHPLIMAAYEIRYLEADSVYGQLIGRRITYGNANRLLHESYLAFRAREERYVRAQDDAWRREQAERDRQTAEEARRWRDSMKSTYAPPKVVVCSWRGSLLICI